MNATTRTDSPPHAFKTWDGTQLLEALQAAEHWLDQQVAAINALNVFPVPDGDTGTNMHLTLSSALRAIEPEASCASVAQKVSTGAMYGARGNSGVILSQILRGIASGLAGHDTCGPQELAVSLVRGSEAAYRGATEPREGTILTVSRETGEAAQAALDAGNADLLSVLEAAVEGARASVVRTPELLEVLRQAGVVDAGGQGYLVILEGMLRWAKGESLTLEQPIEATQNFAAAADDVGHDGFGFCTNVLVSGENLPFATIREHIMSVGESAVVVGDESLIRIHVHTLRPGDILNYVGDHGTIAQVEITNMDLQREALKQKAGKASAEQGVQPNVAYLPDTDNRSPFGTVVVAPGKGFSDLFLSMKADAVVSGGQTMNPSTQDILEAIEAVPQQEVVVLPNNGNIVRAAQEALHLTTKQVQVIPTKTVPQGVAAVLARNYQLPFADNVEAMVQASAAVITAEITIAVRDAQIEGIDVRAGQTIALLNDKLVASGDDQDAVIDDILGQVDLDEREVLTIYYGQQATEAQAAALAERIGDEHPDLTLEVQAGGQPFYDFIFAIE